MKKKRNKEKEMNTMQKIKGFILKQDKIASRASIFMCRLINLLPMHIDNVPITHILGSPYIA